MEWGADWLVALGGDRGGVGFKEGFAMWFVLSRGCVSALGARMVEEMFDRDRR